MSERSFLLLGDAWYIAQFSMWWQRGMSTKAMFSRNVRRNVLCFSRSIPLYWTAWSVNMVSLTISMLMTASCMFPLHQGTLLQHWMVYSHVWPLSSHGCRRINWNWTQITLNSSLSRMNDSGANTFLCFPLSFSVSKLTLINLLGILEWYLIKFHLSLTYISSM